MPRGDFELVTHPDKQPAVDFITRSSVGPFVDTGLDVLVRPNADLQVRKERVYLAEGTLRALCGVAGLVISEDTELAGVHGVERGRQEVIDAVQGEVFKDGLVDLLRRVSGAGSDSL